MDTRYSRLNEAVLKSIHTLCLSKNKENISESVVSFIYILFYSHKIAVFCIDMLTSCQRVLSMKLVHYANTSMQYTVIFHSCKNDNFQIKNCDIFLFLLQTLIVGTR